MSSRLLTGCLLLSAAALPSCADANTTAGVPSTRPTTAPTTTRATTGPATSPSTAPAVIRLPAGVASIKCEVILMKLKGIDFAMEVADSDDKITRGLMYRDSMPDDRGMIFYLGADKPNTAFWMKNTYIPLDIIFLDPAGKVLQIDQRVPLDETGSGPAAPSRYVIELNRGGAAKIGLKVGDIIQIPDNPRK